MLVKSLRELSKNGMLRNQSIRLFGGPAPTKRDVVNGLSAVTRHPDGHDDHHHDQIKTAPLDHKFIQEGVDKNMLVFNGLPSTKNATVALDHEFHHLNDKSMFQ